MGVQKVNRSFVFRFNRMHVMQPSESWYNQLLINKQHDQIFDGTSNQYAWGLAVLFIGDAPTTFEWSTILLPNKVRHILDVWR